MAGNVPDIASLRDVREVLAGSMHEVADTLHQKVQEALKEHVQAKEVHHLVENVQAQLQELHQLILHQADWRLHPSQGQSWPSQGTEDVGPCGVPAEVSTKVPAKVAYNMLARKIAQPRCGRACISNATGSSPVGKRTARGIRPSPQPQPPEGGSREASGKTDAPGGSPRESQRDGGLPDTAPRPPSDTLEAAFPPFGVPQKLSPRNRAARRLVGKTWWSSPPNLHDGARCDEEEQQSTPEREFRSSANRPHAANIVPRVGEMEFTSGRSRFSGNHCSRPSFGTGSSGRGLSTATSTLVERRTSTATSTLVERLTSNSYGIASLDQIDDFVTDCLLDDISLPDTYPSLHYSVDPPGDFDACSACSVMPGLCAPSMNAPHKGGIRKEMVDMGVGQNEDAVANKEHTPPQRATNERVGRAKTWTGAPLNLSHGEAVDMEALRKKNEMWLVSESDPMQEAPEASTHSECCHWLPRFLLAICGILPSSSKAVWKWHRRFVMVFTAALVGLCIALSQLDPEHSYFHLATSCIASGCVLGLYLIWRVQNLLGPQNNPLISQAVNYGFAAKWSAISTQRFCLVSAGWACMVLVKAFQWHTFGSGTLLPLFTAILVDLLLAMIVFCVLHVCCGLELAVDSFCTRFVLDRDLPKSFTHWNTLQALLRRAAHSVEACFLAVNTSVLALLMLTGWEGLEVGPSSATYVLGICGPTTVLVFYMVFRAAVVTERCSRVPSLLNSWITDQTSFVEERHYFVQYVIHSAAGFYVSGARLSAAWALKLFYVLVVVVFSFSMQILRT